MSYTCTGYKRSVKNYNVIIINPSGNLVQVHKELQKRLLNMILSTLPRKMHTKVDTGTCRSARTLKPDYYKMTMWLLWTAPNKTLYDEKQTSKVKETKYDTAGYENPKPFKGKRECIPQPAEISCGAGNWGVEVLRNLWLLNANKQVQQNWQIK